MPGSPATSTRFGAPRYSNADAVDFAGQVNAVTDMFDSKARRLSDPIAETDMATGVNGPAKGAFLAYRNAALTVAQSTAILFDTDSGVGFDISGWYNPATGRYTPQVAGIYELTWQIALSTPLTDGNWLLPQLWKNGSVFAYGQSNGQSGATAALILGGTINLSANGTTDFFDVRQQASGNPSLALAVGAGPIRTFFTGKLLGRT